MTRHEHEHGHEHGCAHTSQHRFGHGHSHTPADFGRAFAIGIALNFGFILAEVGYGLVSNSMALLADAGHNLSDVLGLIAAWTAATLSKKPPTQRFSYGLRGSSILAALANATLLLVACGAIAFEAIGRLFDPQPIAVTTVTIVATIGIAINGATAMMFARGRKDDINIRGAFLHMVADAAISAGVVAGALAIGYTGQSWIDPVISLLIVAIIIGSSWQLLSESVTMSLSAVPSRIDARQVEAYLAGLDNVAHVHDLHIWPISTTETALTAHLVMPGGYPGDEFLQKCAAAVEARFAIAHCTFQIEMQEGCPLEPAHII